jgi:hypothetical protein
MVMIKTMCVKHFILWIPLVCKEDSSYFSDVMSEKVFTRRVPNLITDSHIFFHCLHQRIDINTNYYYYYYYYHHHR